MSILELLSTVAAILAFGLSVGTAYRVWRREAEAAKRADVAVYFHWLTTSADIVLPTGGQARTGYHLVLRNGGPRAAEDVTVLVENSSGETLCLLALEPDEFPLPLLDSGGVYPIPFVLEAGRHEGKRGLRRFKVTLEWRDGRRGRGHKTVWLRRGQTREAVA